MAAVFVAMIVSAGVGVGAASALARHAQRNWKRAGSAGSTALAPTR